MFLLTCERRVRRDSCWKLNRRLSEPHPWFGLQIIIFECVLKGQIPRCVKQQEYRLARQVQEIDLVWPGAAGSNDGYRIFIQRF